MTWLAVTKFFKSIPSWLYVLVLLAAVLYFYGASQKDAGRAEVQAQWDKSRAKGKAIVEDLTRRANTITTVTETKFVEVEKVITKKGDTLVQYVDRYIPQGGGCTNDGMLSGAFRVQHDGAATNTIPDSTAYANGKAVSVTDTARTVTENYTGCLINAAKLEAWQSWANEQCKLNDKGCPDGG